MKNTVEWFFLYAISAISLGLLALGLVAGGAVLQFKALILVLTPVVGPASAYALTGLACFAVVLLPLLIVRMKRAVKRASARHPAPASSTPAASTGAPIDSALKITQKYPLESVMVAFAAGLSSSDADELKRMATALLREGSARK